MYFLFANFEYFSISYNRNSIVFVTARRFILFIKNLIAWNISLGINYIV